MYLTVLNFTVLNCYVLHILSDLNVVNFDEALKVLSMVLLH